MLPYSGQAPAAAPPPWDATYHVRKQWKPWFAWRPVRVKRFECIEHEPKYHPQQQDRVAFRVFRKRWAWLRRVARHDELVDARALGSTGHYRYRYAELFEVALGWHD